MSWLDSAALDALGLRSVGPHVLIDDTVRFYGAKHISIGAYTRIDAQTIITAGPGSVEIGEHVHIAAGVYVFGTAGVRLDDFSGLSSRVVVYSTSDDFPSGVLTGPTVDDDLRAVNAKPVHIGRHAVVGAACVVLPGVTLSLGSAAGATSLVRRDVPEGAIVGGNPARIVSHRDVERLLRGEQEARRRDAPR
jgi:galactoside O-acetyltransferase